MKTTTVLNVRITPDIDHWLEQQQKKNHTNSKSETLRDLLREMITSHE